jgi:hypothetical protein
VTSRNMKYTRVAAKAHVYKRRRFSTNHGRPHSCQKSLDDMVLRNAA